ncbi:MAG: CDP-diacylglycerol--glycerol-3-phosphate 3-phosphatidyltransferase [Galactobacter sp.]|uniref:CDP-diacylglycerol--glycerol-3-phosphate 3-phosphatidyltransferase n=1 Tax=Galactobacter sp. TaxID=2676125 RepID=UPI0025BA9B11|nr:CDP-diacylglycerol--glycerol-3-phosphate 3-phosphatidyltransferase [Galactobacter sp.]
MGTTPPTVPAGEGADATPAPNWNIANILTGLRIIMVPVFVVFFVLDDHEGGLWRWLALVIFVAAIYTDKLDGDLARSRNLVTSFGKIADPIADKLLIGSALVLFSIYHELSWWITGIILVREIGITVMRFVVVKWGVIAASPGGKLKTVSQAVGIIVLLLPFALDLLWVAWIGWVIIGIAAALTLYSAIDYIRQATALYKAHKAGQA